MTSPLKSGSGIPTSPPRALAADRKAKAKRTNYQRTTAEFASDVELMKACIRAYNRLAARVYATSSRISSGSTDVGRDELRSQLSAICANLDHFAKYFRASARKEHKVKPGAKPRTGTQLMNLFYVSDQLVGFIMEANKGNGLAALVGCNSFRVVAKDTKDVEGQEEQHKRALALIADWTARITAAGMAPGSESYNNLCRANGADPATRQLINGAFDALGGLAAVDQFQGALGYALDNADVNVSLQALLAHNVANSGMLVACLHLIARVNQLQSTSNGQRVHYDAVWEKHFLNSDSHYRIGGQDITAALIASLPRDPAELEARLRDLTENNKKHLDDIKDHLTNANKSVFQRISERPAVEFERPKGKVVLDTFIRREAAQAGTDNWGVLYAMFMVIISLNHIPSYMVSPQQRAAIKSVVGPDGVEQNQLVANAENLRQYITGLLNVHGDIFEPMRKAKLVAANKASNEAKKAAKAAKAAVAPAPQSPGRRVGF